ncbi:MAG: glycosyltransferase, partial [Bacteroidia bacterium]
MKKNIADYGLEKIYFIPDFKLINFFAFIFIPIYEYLLVKSKINILHLHCSYPIILFAYTLKLFGLKKIVLTEHWSGYTTYDGAYDRLPFFLKFFLKKMLSSLSAISLVSDVLKNEMQNRNLLPEKTYIIPNVLNIPTILINNKPKDYFSFITICTLEDKTKNITGIIDAFKEAVLINNNIKLTIYGDGIDEDKLKKYAHSLGLLNSYIFFEGYIPNEKISEIYFK